MLLTRSVTRQMSELRDPVRNIGWWVDDAGDFRPYRVSANDHPRAGYFGEGDPFPRGGPEARIALRRLGMVRVERTGSGLGVEWDIQNAEPGALRAVLRSLGTEGSGGRVDLTFRYGGWAKESYTSPLAAARRIEELKEYRGETPKTMIAYEAHGLDDLDGAKPLLKAAHDRWKASTAGRLEHFDSPFRAVTPYTLMLSESNAPGSLFYRSIGQKAHMVSYLGKEWARDVIGTLSTHGHSDIEFEQVVSEPYFEAIRTGKPHYGHVRALFAVDEAEPDWVSYQRLILPYDAANGEKAVSIMVVPDQDVSIPFLRPDKTDGVDG